jgi:hypothetical protein
MCVLNAYLVLDHVLAIEFLGHPSERLRPGDLANRVRGNLNCSCGHLRASQCSVDAVNVNPVN